MTNTAHHLTYYSLYEDFTRILEINQGENALCPHLRLNYYFLYGNLFTDSVTMALTGRLLFIKEFEYFGTK